MAAIARMMHARPPALYMAQRQAITTRPEALAGLRDIVVPTTAEVEGRMAGKLRRKSH